MNIVELNEKNLNDALNVYKKTKARYFEALGKDLPDDKTIEDSLYCDETGAITFLFVEKSVVYGLVTVNKSTAEIENLCIDFAIADDSVKQRMLEFAIKQFSTITLVFVWADSTATDVSDLLESYGFEYTGEQDYIDKQRGISRNKYVFRRKK